jgi:hypothetical protein
MKYDFETIYQKVPYLRDNLLEFNTEIRCTQCHGKVPATLIINTYYRRVEDCSGFCIKDNLNWCYQCYDEFEDLYKRTLEVGDRGGVWKRLDNVKKEWHKIRKEKRQKLVPPGVGGPEQTNQ